MRLLIGRQFRRAHVTLVMLAAIVVLVAAVAAGGLLAGSGQEDHLVGPFRWAPSVSSGLA